MIELLFVVLSCFLHFFFFFSSRRRHTRLQGDWSSDVCSSDLRWRGARRARLEGPPGLVPARGAGPALSARGAAPGPPLRSEERRVGKECRSWWSRKRGETKKEEVWKVTYKRYDERTERRDLRE